VTDPREAVGEDPATEIRGELTLDVAWQATSLRVRGPQLGEHRLRMTRDQLVQHRALRRAALAARDWLSGRAGRPFVQTAAEHVPAL
jgi:hypothetical protein